MKFFFPDSQDLVDPSFDFVRETRSPDRVRQRQEVYAHEVFSSPVCDGLLVSKGIVDGIGGSLGRYTLAQRQRLFRVGAREFFRTDRPGRENLPVMGDCGAFTYVRHKVPPYSVDEVINFYLDCGFDLGISVDHVILAYQPRWDIDAAVPPDVRERQELTLELAAEFLSKHRVQGLAFTPLGVAQGWSPLSYASAVEKLQTMGYRYIALGGMVPLKTPQILACLAAIGDVRTPETQFHLLGVTRTSHIVEVAEKFGVVSFDSTSPLRQAFKDDSENYHTMDGAYSAVRIPQVEGNPSLEKRIRAGMISQDRARLLERSCLEAVQKCTEAEGAIDEALEALRAYEELCADPERPRKDRTDAYRKVLTDQPWKDCPCDVCRDLGHHVILFRGAERNRRRGFHNVWVFYRKLKRELGFVHADSGSLGSRERQYELLGRPAAVASGD